MTKHTCTCTACNGKAITAPEGYITGTPKQVEQMVHNYVQYAHGSAPVGKIMCQRAGIAAA